MSDEVARPATTPFQDRVAQAAKVMGITVDEAWKCLEDLGVENSPDGQAILEADTTQESDAREFFVCPLNGKGGVKIARFKAGWAVLKGKSREPEKVVHTVGSHENLATVTEIGKLVESLKPVNQLSDEELLNRYNEDSGTDILEELKRRSKDRNFVVFNESTNTVDVKSTLVLLRQAKRQEIASTFMVEGKIVRTQKVGMFPMSFFEECPIHADTILTDGYCDSCKNTWKGIKDVDRVIVRVAIGIEAIDVGSIAKVYELIEKIKSEGSAGFLLKLPPVELHYRELQEDNKLPVLRRKVSRTGTAADPFYQK